MGIILSLLYNYINENEDRVLFVCLLLFSNDLEGAVLHIDSDSPHPLEKWKRPLLWVSSCFFQAAGVLGRA